MIWAQGLTCFLVWIAYGVIQARRSNRIRARLSGMSRGVRTGLGAVCMLVGIGVMFCGLLAAQSTGAFTENGLTSLGLLAVAVVGLIFVHAQTLAMAMMVSLMQETVTTATPPASDHQPIEGIQQ